MNIIAQLTSNTQIVVSLGGLLAILGGIGAFLGTLIALVYKASNKLGGIEQSLDRLATAVNNCWTKHEQERFCYRLEKANRKIGLTVPSTVSDSMHGVESSDN